MDFDALRNKLPIANQSFLGLRQAGHIYVDKTDFVYKLANTTIPQILTRPRRFGKSTLLTTLEELFRHGVKPYDGHDSYFKGLAIEQLWQDDGQYLVLHLDFHELNSDCDTIAEFEQSLMEEITDFCTGNKITIPDKSSFRKRLKALLEQLPYQSLVLLIDEFDAPLLYHYDNEQELHACKLLMRGLFSTIKRNPDKFRCVFFTGITRFQDLDIGTAGNSFTDISLDKGFAACCGYTRAELKQYFAQHLRYAVAIRARCAPEAVSDKQIENLLGKMSSWYDGYSFNGAQQNKVFSTWSVLRFLSNEEAVLDAYWSDEEGSGLPQVLKLALDRIELEPLIAQLSQGEIVIGGREFRQSSLINPKANPYSLLFQTGYLTLSKPFRSTGKAHLVCPNREIKWAFTNLLMRHFFQIEFDICYSESSQKVLAALASLDPEKMRAAFNEAIGILPYSHSPENEFWIASLMVILLFGLNLKPRAEVMSLNGRADCVFDLPEHKVTIVFEFKFEASSNPKKLDAKLAEALKQIKKRKYVLDGNSQPKVARFGLVFCAAKGERGFARVGKADEIDRSLTAFAQTKSTAATKTSRGSTASTQASRKATAAATKASSSRNKTSAQTTTAQKASTAATKTSRGSTTSTQASRKVTAAATKTSSSRNKTAAQTTTAQNASAKAESTSPTKRKKSQSTITKDKA